MKKSPLLFVAAATFHLLTFNAKGAVIYWDGGSATIVTTGNGISQGGSGTWNSLIRNWDAGNGLVHVASSSTGTATFGGTAGTVTLTSTLSITGLVFNTDGYVVSGSTTLSLKTGGITANANATVSSPLTLSHTHAWTAASGKTLTVTGAVNNNGKKLTLSGAGNIALSGVLSGSGTLVKTSTGLLTLRGANTYTGITTLGGGVINVGVTETAGTSGALGKSTSTGSILFTGGTLQYSSANTFDYSSRFSTAAGQLWRIDTNGQNVTYATGLSGTGSFSKLGTGTLTLSGTSTFSGGTTINAGILNVTGGLADIGAVTINGGTYTAGSIDTVGAITLVSGTMNGTGTLTGSSYGFQSGSVSTILAGSGALTKSTTGTVTLSGASTFTGGTTISGGILNVTGTLADSGAINVSGGTYTVGANDTVGAVTLTSGTIDGTSTLTGSSYGVQSGSVSAVLAGTGALTKSTGGTVTLSGVNTYTGATTVSAGNLIISGSLASGSAVSVAGGAILSGTGTVGGTVTVASSATSEIRVGDGVTGSLTLGNLTMSGAGVITIGTLGNYTSSAALKVTGTLTLSGGAGAVSLTLPAGVLSNGTYHLISHSNTLSALTGLQVTGPAIGVRQAASLTNSAGVIDYIVTGDTPYWIGTGTAWNTGAANWKLIIAETPTSFLANDAVLFNDNATGTTTVDIATAVNPAVTSFANSTKDYTLQGAAGITTGSLTKSGTGSLTITNTNTYNG